MKTITIYADPGHAWAKVKYAELKKLGISDKISYFSYRRGEYVYLEEDGDLQIYLSSLKPGSFKFREFHTNRSSRVRNYERYLEGFDSIEEKLINK